MTLVIMAAGMGSRYGGLKQLDPINRHGEFIIDYSIYDAVRAGFDKVVFIIKEENLADFRETVSKRIEGSVKVDFAFQRLDNIPDGFSIPDGRTKPWGTGHAVLAAADVVNEPFAVINSDDFYGSDAFIKLHDFLLTQKDAKSDGKAHYAMAGYILENTITENGYVSRGICEVENGHLVRVTERTKIQENSGVIQYNENDVWHDLDRKAVVSMNCWAFTPAVFDALKSGFTQFMRELPDSENPQKAEFFLPFFIQSCIDDGSCDVRVLETGAKWYGVTYREDKPRFVAFIESETKTGAYPDGLWK